MSLGLAFWILMLVWAAFGVIGVYRSETPWWGWGGTVLHFVLFLLLGWQVFGPPLHG
jgi:hypothetical protein